MEKTTNINKKLLVYGAVLRLAMLILGEYLDTTKTTYTDIDYFVFTDASRYVFNLQSPYLRATYRYTPLLSWLLVPNIFVHKAFGKLLFVGFDLAIGVVLDLILEERIETANLVAATRGAERKALGDQYQSIKNTNRIENENKSKSKSKSNNAYTLLEPSTISTNNACGKINKSVYLGLWLLNPIVANISTRGNSESMISVVVLLSLYYFTRKRYDLSAVLFGLSVHLKIYPAVYCVPILVILAGDKAYGYYEFLPKIFNKRQYRFGIISFGVFMGLNALMYMINGHEFLSEALLYHFSRKDHRHNFSVWFLSIYQLYNSPSIKLYSLLFSFLPQLFTVILVGIKFGNDLYFAAFCQTFVFVIFNKVYTAQYFMWFFSFLPIIFPFTNIKLRYKGIFLILLWIASQAYYLNIANQFENMGMNVLYELWVSNIILFVSNVYILIELINNQNIIPIDKIKIA